MILKALHIASFKVFAIGQRLLAKGRRRANNTLVLTALRRTTTETESPTGSSRRQCVALRIAPPTPMRIHPA